MTELELIGKQQLEIEELKTELELAKTNLGQIRMFLIACGGPLNDNYLQYSSEQRVIFFRIKNLVDECIE